LQAKSVKDANSEIYETRTEQNMHNILEGKVNPVYRVSSLAAVKIS